MSEEEIIEQLENCDMFIDTLYETYKQNTVKPFEKAIQGLLDLYNKQKEEIEQLKNAEEHAKLGKETLLDTIHKQQKEIEELKFIRNEQQKDIEFLKLTIKGDYISKDKIRDKIKELENKLENFYEEVGKGFYFNNEYVNSVKMAINKLYGLLEE